MDSMMVLQEDTEDMSDLKVVPNYEFVPANKRSNGDTGGSSAQMMIDPISGKAIPIDQMTEHMRIQLLDPKWRQQQKVFMDKQKETGYAEGVSIADSLKQFARKRGDIFGQAASGSGPNSAAAIAEQDAADKKKQEV
jgi:splicing factor 3A subunit 1